MPLRLLVCFAAGSIPFAILAMLGSGVDIQQVGSGNPGFNNVLRVNKWRAVLTLIGDMGKGFTVVWLCKQPGDGVAVLWLYGFAAVLGHCFSPFLRFNGGKGIATSGGVMLVLYPMWAVAALVVFTLVRVTGGKLKWKEAGTIGSMSAWVSFTLLMLVFVDRQDALLAGVMTLFLAWRHKKNFQNLLAAAALVLLLGPVTVRGHAQVTVSAQRSGHHIECADARTAATALLYDAPLVTHHGREYLGVQGLTVFSEES